MEMSRDLLCLSRALPGKWDPWRDEEQLFIPVHSTSVGLAGTVLLWAQDSLSLWQKTWNFGLAMVTSPVSGTWWGCSQLSNGFVVITSLQWETHTKLHSWKTASFHLQAALLEPHWASSWPLIAPLFPVLLKHSSKASLSSWREIAGLWKSRIENLHWGSCGWNWCLRAVSGGKRRKDK